MKKIVITGASGFLGRKLIERLQKEDEVSLYALSRSFCGKEAETQLFGNEDLNKITFLHSDRIGSKEAADILKNAMVINCAFPRAVEGKERAIGLLYIKDLLNACKKYEAAAFVDISSQSVYSPKRNAPAKETDFVSLDSVYAAAKYAVELMTEAVFESSQTAYTHIRLASLIGAGFDMRIVNRFVNQAKENKEISVTDDEKRFGFMDVADAADGLAAMLSTEPAQWKKVYNLGIRGSYSLKTIAETIREVFRENGTEVRLTVSKAEGYECSALDAESFYQDFGFEPKISLQESIRRIAFGTKG